MEQIGLVHFREETPHTSEPADGRGAVPEGLPTGTADLTKAPTERESADYGSIRECEPRQSSRSRGCGESSRSAVSRVLGGGCEGRGCVRSCPS